jgi:7-cyano-7-deazaguanine synthase
MSHNQRAEVALLLSGGLDSSILLAHLLSQRHTVQPIYIGTDAIWQAEELAAIKRFLSAMWSSHLKPLVQLSMPIGDLYGRHWSTTRHGTPAEGTPDETVYLPGRNPLLLVKSAVYCQMHHIEEIALAALASNPFADATDEFFAAFERAMTLAGRVPLRILRPFAAMTKMEVMQLGRNYPLAHTFSCIAPLAGVHCGGCNKCGERKSAFDIAGIPDPTHYAHHAPLTTQH